MSTDTQQNTAQLPVVSQPRLPYHPGIETRFGVDQTEWRALVESTFPSAKTVGAVILALAYCKARNLDPFKKTVHIVPIWDKERRCYVETVWPGIAEYRTTAVRTKSYAGHDEAAHGPMTKKTWGEGKDAITVEFPEWSQMTVYRMVGGERCSFPGPKVYWIETYASKKNGEPNTMWAGRPIGMIDKCAEAAALRGAFPEELGGETAYEEHGGFRWHGRDAICVESEEVPRLQGVGKAARLSQQLSGERSHSKPQGPADGSEAAGGHSEPAASAEHEPSPEPSTDDEAIDFSQAVDELQFIDKLGDLENAKKNIPENWTPEHQQKYADRIEMRMAEIRGSGSNGPQGSLLDKKESATEQGH